MAVTTGPRFGLTRWSADSDPPVNRGQLDDDNGSLETLAVGFLRGTIGARPAAAAANAGYLYEATDQSNKLYWSTGAAWIPITPDVVVKGVDESVTSSIALQNDDALLVALAANTDYAFKAWLNVTGHSSGDLSLAFTVPAAATIAWDAVVNTDGSLASYTIVTASGAAAAVQLSSGAAGSLVRVAGIVRTGATAGALQMQWAQVASFATATTVKAGSWLKVLKETS